MRPARVRFGRRPGAPPRIIGHRGASPPPENTLPAFEEAARQGADAFELDVRLCATGEVVVLHDPDLARVTGGADRREVAALPYEALRRVDLGGARVPLLHEALSLARALGLAVNVEMKSDVPDRLALVRATARLLHAWDPRSPVLVSSFDAPMLAALGALLPRAPRALLVSRGRWHELALRAAPALGVMAVHLERTLTSPAQVEALRRRGFLINIWTVNHEAEARDLADLGVDGLITDEPRRLRLALAGPAPDPAARG